MHFTHPLIPSQELLFLHIFVNLNIVIQRSKATKNLGSIKWVLPRFFTPLRSVLNDKWGEFFNRYYVKTPLKSCAERVAQEGK